MGAGNWGKNLIRVVGGLASADLVLVADPDPKAREYASAAAPGAKVCADISEGMDEFDIAFVATPSRDHFAHVGFFTDADKDVLVEKPFAMSLTAAASLARKSQEAGTVLMVGHQMLFHPGFAKLQTLVGDGAIGRLMSIRAEREGALDFSREPGVLWAFGPHDAAMIIALTGEAPRSVSASGVASAGRADAASEVTVALEFPSGVNAEIALCTAGKKHRRLLVQGELATAVFEDNSPGGALDLFDSLSDAVAGRAGRPVSYVYQEPLARECEHFAECVHSRSTPLTGVDHALEVTRILDNAARALADDRNLKVAK